MNGLTMTALLLCTASNAFAPTATFSRSSSHLSMTSSNTVSRFDFMKQAASAATAAVITSTAASSFPAIASAEETVTLPSGVTYVIKTKGDGPKPEIGQLAGIRFRAVCTPTGNVVDDILSTPEPYYTRVGAGALLKGVEEVLPKMVVGDRFFLTIPGPLAFGAKGRPSSAGKPRIPANAEITFDVEMVGLPGLEKELIELIGDD